VARTWVQIRVDLLGGGGIDCDPSPGRVFIVGASHSFEVFAEAIDAAFARWDLSHLHSFDLADGRLIGFPDDMFEPDVVWLDHAKLKVAREVKPGDEFEYVFDLGDNWRHRCTVAQEKAIRSRSTGSFPIVRSRSRGGARSPTSMGAAASTARGTKARSSSRPQAVRKRWQTTAQPSSMNA
jgi:hypothetical protein